MRRDFFATVDDLVPVCESVELEHRVAYIAAGMFASSAPVRFNTFRDALLLSQPGAAAYLVACSHVPVNVRAIPQLAGGTLYAVDELENPSCITLQIGRSFGKELLCPGLVGTTATEGAALVLHRAFATAIGKHFKRVQSYWVGPAALAMLKDGKRLTVGPKSPPEFDLAYGREK